MQNLKCKEKNASRDGEKKRESGREKTITVFLLYHFKDKINLCIIKNNDKYVETF